MSFKNRKPRMASLQTVLRLASGFFILLFLLPLAASAQDDDGKNDNYKTLEGKQKKIEAKVKKTQQLLKQTRKKKRKSFVELTLLKKEIGLREQLVGSLSNQIVRVDDEIIRMSGMEASMEADVKKFQNSYAKAARLSYKTHTKLSMLLWIFSASSFRQAYDRAVYFREFGKYRKKQIKAIRRLRQFVNGRKVDMELHKLEKNKLLGKRLKEKELLAMTRDEKDKLYKQLKSSESDYRAEIKKARQDLAQIRADIRRMVLESKKAKSENKEVAAVYDKLSTNFQNNKGKLPWPVSLANAEITGYFGKTQTATGNEIINDGIYISTTEGEKARAVFGGVVTMIGKIPSYGKVVIIQHGNYRTVYANLESVYVEKGDNVETLKEIGKVRTNGAGETQIYFQIYRDFNPINPSVWIVGK